MPDVFACCLTIGSLTIVQESISSRFYSFFCGPFQPFLLERNQIFPKPNAMHSVAGVHGYVNG